MTSALVASFIDYFWHPLNEGAGSTCSATNHTGCGYSLWSGIAGSFVASIPAWLCAFALYLVHHNCHRHRCLRLSWHPHPSDGHPVCKRHHPHHPRGGTTDTASPTHHLRRLIL